jgi:hypothetical protein
MKHVKSIFERPSNKIKKKIQKDHTSEPHYGIKTKKINVLYSVGTYHLLRVTSLLLERY